MIETLAKTGIFGAIATNLFETRRIRHATAKTLLDKMIDWRTATHDFTCRGGCSDEETKTRRDNVARLKREFSELFNKSKVNLATKTRNQFEIASDELRKIEREHDYLTSICCKLPNEEADAAAKQYREAGTAFTRTFKALETMCQLR
jgi:hypothetical protein